MAVSRTDAFFGLHFDLHPGKKDTSLGAETSEESISELLDRVKPDYVQYDCKGHPGYTGYPTKIGWPSPGIVKDSLKIWRKVTKEHGVGLYIHYSGVWDSVAIEHHPEWGAVNADGSVSDNSTSIFSSYVNELFIPQLIEVCKSYDLDGVWVDGDCWAAKLDYSSAALKKWKELTGRDAAPKNRDEPHWLEWKNFHRDQFDEYLCRWVDSLHEACPGLEITSNWMYTAMSPRPVVADLDFLSGDYSPGLSVDRARTDARYLANTGMPWDLMTWGFDRDLESALGHSMKPAVHLMQESSMSLMQGGGFQIYYVPIRTGHIPETAIDIAGEVASFCRARQDVSHKSSTVPQIALLHSAQTTWDRVDVPYTPSELPELEGALHALLELHYSVDVLTEHQLQPQLDDFPLLVIPDSYELDKSFIDSVVEYVEQGGGLFLLGSRCASLFESALGIRFDGPAAETIAEIATPHGPVNVNGAWRSVTLDGAKPIGYRHPTKDTRKDGEIAAAINSVGKGKIAAVYGPLAEIFFNTHHPWLRSFIGEIVAELFPQPAVEVDAPPTVDIALRRTKNGRLSLHLANVTCRPLSGRSRWIDFIPSVGPINVRMQASEKPKTVSWIPDGDSLEWSWEDGILSVVVPRLHIHGVIAVD